MPAPTSARSSQALRTLAASLVPGAETYASVALAPIGAGGRDVDVVRLALQDPAALAKRRQEVAPAAPEPKGGVVIDISRKRVLLDGEVSPLTYKEFELLQFLVLREGRTIDRHEIIATLWADGEGDDDPERAHHRRARAASALEARRLRRHRAHGARRRDTASTVTRMSPSAGRRPRRPTCSRIQSPTGTRSAIMAASGCARTPRASAGSTTRERSWSSC